MCDALEDAGHAVTGAADGAEALRMMRARHFDVVLTDLKMPVIDSGAAGVDPRGAAGVRGDRADGARVGGVGGGGDQARGV